MTESLYMIGPEILLMDNAVAAGVVLVAASVVVMTRSLSKMPP